MPASHIARRQLSTVALVVLIAAAALLCAVASASAKGFQLNYVALGDSYAAGPVIPNQIAVDTPPGCAQSDHNYPHDLAALTSFVQLTDVSCSGATTVDMTAPQVTAAGTNAPQLDAVNQHTDVVTVTIGGNDIGFSSIIVSCISPVPTGHPCQDRYVTAAGDQLRQRIDATAPKIAAVLNGIRSRARHARIIVVGYPAILPPTVGCWPQMPYTPDDVPYLDGIERYLNKMLRDEAAAHRAGYADSYRATLGHDSCQSVDNRWVEPLSPGNPAAPVHPNIKGEAAMARATLWGLFF